VPRLTCTALEREERATSLVTELSTWPSRPTWQSSTRSLLRSSSAVATLPTSRLVRIITPVAELVLIRTAVSTLGAKIPGLVYISDSSNHASMIEGESIVSL
jgi:hypothetical protein